MFAEVRDNPIANVKISDKQVGQGGLQGYVEVTTFNVPLAGIMNVTIE